MLKELFSSVTLFFASLVGLQDPQTTATIVPTIPPPILAVSPPASFPATPATSSPTTTVNYITQPVIKRIVEPVGSRLPIGDLAPILGAFRHSLRNDVTTIVGNSVGGSIDVIDSGLALADLTDANIPDDISVSGALSITGATEGSVPFVDPAGKLTDGTLNFNSSLSYLGVGTTSPTENLYVYGNDAQTDVFFDAGGARNVRLFLQNTNGSLSFVYANGGGRADFSINGTRWATISSSGNFGVGTDITPDYLLDVQGTFHADGISTFDGDVGIGTSTPWAKLSVTNTGTAPSIIVEDSTSPDTTPFVVDADGKVGIGTSTPSNNLHVAGTARIEIDTGTPLNLSRNQSGDNRTFMQWNQLDTTDGNGARFRYVSDTTGTGGATSQTFSQIQFFADTHDHPTRSGSIVFYTLSNGSFASRLTIAPSGNIGIATSTPWRTLSVSGSVGVDGLTGATGAGSLCLSADNEVVYNSGSDACLPSLRETKNDIAPLDLDAVATIIALEPVSFAYNQSDGRTRFGLIAEDTAAVLAPLATYNASSTISGIDDRAVLSVVVKSIKEIVDRLALLFDNDTRHDAELEALRTRISELESRFGIKITAPLSAPVTDPKTASDIAPSEPQDGAGLPIVEIETEKAAEPAESESPSIAPASEPEDHPKDSVGLPLASSSPPTE